MTPKQLTKFLTQSQHLKSILRHSWTDDPNRQESVSDHSWHMSLMALIFQPYLQHPVNLLRVLELVAIHDLGEIVTGDIPAFSVSQLLKNKQQKEEKAVLSLTKNLPNRQLILSLWCEYEERTTPESLFVKMLDVLDVILQHLVADISTWSEEEFTFSLQRNAEKYFAREPFLLQVYGLIHQQLALKVKKTNS